MGDDSSGEIVFNPNDILPNGVIGSYSFNFSFGDAYDFEDTQRTYELLAANMPFLQNNMDHFIGQSSENGKLRQTLSQIEGQRLAAIANISTTQRGIMGAIPYTCLLYTSPSPRD